MGDDSRLVKELRAEVKDERRGLILDAYLTKPTSDAMATKALEILAEDIGAIEKP